LAMPTGLTRAQLRRRLASVCADSPTVAPPGWHRLRITIDRAGDVDFLALANVASQAQEEAAQLATGDAATTLARTVEGALEVFEGLGVESSVEVKSWASPGVVNLRAIAVAAVRMHDGVMLVLSARTASYPEVYLSNPSWNEQMVWGILRSQNAKHLLSQLECIPEDHESDARISDVDGNPDQLSSFADDPSFDVCRMDSDSDSEASAPSSAEHSAGDWTRSLPPAEWGKGKVAEQYAHASPTSLSNVTAMPRLGLASHSACSDAESRRESSSAPQTDVSPGVRELPVTSGPRVSIVPSSSPRGSDGEPQAPVVHCRMDSDEDSSDGEEEGEFTCGLCAECVRMSSRSFCHDCDREVCHSCSRAPRRQSKASGAAARQCLECFLGSCNHEPRPGPLHAIVFGFLRDLDELVVAAPAATGSSVKEVEQALSGALVRLKEEMLEKDRLAREVIEARESARQSRAVVAALPVGASVGDLQRMWAERERVAKQLAEDVRTPRSARRTPRMPPSSAGAGQGGLGALGPVDEETGLSNLREFKTVGVQTVCIAAEETKGTTVPAVPAPAPVPAGPVDDSPPAVTTPPVLSPRLDGDSAGGIQLATDLAPGVQPEMCPDSFIGSEAVSGLPITWQPDEFRCPCCDIEFNALWSSTRRHHCRACGKLACGTCASRRSLVRGGKPTWVCPDCKPFCFKGLPFL